MFNINFEQLWLKWVNLKHPTIVIGSDDYNRLRKAFYCGGYIFARLVMQTPNGLLGEILPDVYAQLDAEIRRENRETLKPRSTLNT